MKSNFADGTSGSMIKYYRKKKGITIGELELITGLERNTIYNYEKNSKDFLLSTCQKIAAALDFDPQLIYDDYLLFIVSDYPLLLTGMRKSQNLTKKKFAETIGVSACTVGSWETGISTPSRSMFNKIKQHMNFIDTRKKK